MPVTNYYTVNGEIIGEQTTGQERIDYLTDPLGNVTATIDQNAKVLNRYTYKPFGEVLSKEGTAPDPKFLWVGAHGYRQTGKKYADVYIRKRTYDTSGGRWTSRDPLWPRQPAYNYGKSNPVVMIDVLGMLPMIADNRLAVICWTKKPISACQILNGLDEEAKNKIRRCAVTVRPPGGSCNWPPGLLNCMIRKCKENSPTVECNLGKNECAPPDPQLLLGVDLPSGGKNLPKRCAKTHVEDCTITLCANVIRNPEWCGDVGGDRNLDPIDFNLLHELAHCCGMIDHGVPPGLVYSDWECQDILACCILTGGDSERCKCR